MKKVNYKNKKAFTLIELLVVIVIIGILFVVLVSKVDFATDKAKSIGVQTTFRSYQMAFESVARGHAGFNRVGWDIGDLNGNWIQDSYDEGDINKNGKTDNGEVWTGHKVKAETWTGIFTFQNPANPDDQSAYAHLEYVINSHLDPSLHITIADNGDITMANGEQDPWMSEYEGKYMTNADVDGLDRGAIVIYSKGPNGELGTEFSISNGAVTITNPGNSIEGKDDYVLVTIYTFKNDIGEVASGTAGFNNNQFVNSVIVE